MIYVSRRLIITCLLLVSACVVAGIWGLRSGAVTLETSQVFAALMGDAPRSMTMVVTEWRLPRVLMALLIGAALGVRCPSRCQGSRRRYRQNHRRRWL